MIEFKIEYNSLKYSTYKKIHKFLVFTYWENLDSFESLELAEASLEEYKKFPKYYRF